MRTEGIPSAPTEAMDIAFGSLGSVFSASASHSWKSVKGVASGWVLMVIPVQDKTGIVPAFSLVGRVFVCRLRTPCSAGHPVHFLMNSSAGAPNSANRAAQRANPTRSGINRSNRAGPAFGHFYDRPMMWLGVMCSTLPRAGDNCQFLNRPWGISSERQLVGITGASGRAPLWGVVQRQRYREFLIAGVSCRIFKIKAGTGGVNRCRRLHK